MKTTKKLLKGFIVTLLGGVIIISCNNKERLELDTDTSSAEDNAIAEDAFSNVFRDVNENADTTNNLRSGCPIVTITTSTVNVNGFPKTVTLDYGNGCGAKKGVITAVFSGPFLTSGSVVTITYSNFSYSGYNVNTTSHTITNTGKNSSGHSVFNVDIVGATLVGSDGTISWSATKVIEWSEGESTVDISDDVFLISGTRTGTSRSGVNYTVTVAASTPLKVATSCQWIQSGVATLTPSGKDPRTIDFGSGACDNDATVTIKGNTYNVEL